MLRIAGLPVWVGPSDMIAGARAVLGWTDDAVELVASLPERVTGLLDDVEVLLERISAAVDRVDAVALQAETAADRVDAVAIHADVIADRVNAVALHADAVADGAAAVAEKSGAVVDQAAAATAGASAILGVYEPILARAAPLAQAFVSEFSEAELQAAIKLIDQLPQLTEHLETDVMPILVTLDRVGPDVHELLDVLKEVRMAIQGIPGFRLLRRRGEEREDAEQNAH